MDRFLPEPQQASNVFTIWVTPHLAKAWLEHDTHNRPPSTGPVETYLSEMNVGAWRETGENIAWSGGYQDEWPYVEPDAVLLNGSHRLRAAVRSEAGFPVYIAYGIPLAGQDRIDIGRKRTYADQLSLHGESETATLAAVSRRLYGWLEGTRTYTSYMTAKIATRTDLDRTIEENPDIRNAVRYARTHRLDGITPTLTGLGYLLFHRIDPDDCAVFFDRFLNGVDLKKESPILHLRNRVAQWDAESVRQPEGLVFAHLVKAWNMFRDGQNVKVTFRIRTTGPAAEAYPEPH